MQIPINLPDLLSAKRLDAVSDIFKFCFLLYTKMFRESDFLEGI